MTRNVPLDPIRLTLDDDFLIEFAGNHLRDSDVLMVDSVGTHENCRGVMKRRHSNHKFDCLVCTGCYLRILFYKEIRTYGELREYLVIEFNNLKAHRVSPWRA